MCSMLLLILKLNVNIFFISLPLKLLYDIIITLDNLYNLNYCKWNKQISLLNLKLKVSLIGPIIKIFYIIINRTVIGGLKY